jgi:His/Glu/Gln/Arg/opine family amino acid ABC transporter permease subunit
MAYAFNFSEVLANIDLLLRGVALTTALWAIALAFGLMVGLPLGLARSSDRTTANWPATAYIEIFRNTPVLIQLVWFYYAFPVLTGLQMAPFAELAKMTSIASVITVHELMYEARTLSTQSFLPLETFSVVAVIYLLLIYPGTLAAYLLENRLRAKGG